MAAKVKRSGDAVHVRGLASMQRAFRQVEGDLSKTLRKELREAAKPIAAKAQSNVPHKTGRHGKDGPIKVRVGVTQKAVSIYSNAPHSAVQDMGGRVGHGAVITRASASAYMSKAVKSSRADIEAGLERVGRTIEQEYGRG